VKEIKGYIHNKCIWVKYLHFFNLLSPMKPTWWCKDWRHVQLTCFGQIKLVILWLATSFQRTSIFLIRFKKYNMPKWGVLNLYWLEELIFCVDWVPLIFYFGIISWHNYKWDECQCLSLFNAKYGKYILAINRCKSLFIYKTFWTIFFDDFWKINTLKIFLGLYF
jgi:hypothetical protein